MDWNTETILDTVKKLRHDCVYLKESEIESKYSEFKDNFPKLYYTTLTPNFNMTMLENMLKFRNKAEQENIPDLVRDVTIGEEMAKKYLYPVVGEPTVEQKKKAAKKVAQKVAQQQGL